MTTSVRSTAATALGAVALAGFALFLASARPAGQGPVFGAWGELGPRPFPGINPAPNPSVYETMSGQPSSIAVDLTNDPSGNTVYVATAGGGVWKSTNGLAGSPQFTLISDPSLPASSGALALDSRTNPPMIYVGTGDPDNPSNVNSYAGGGILVSRDGGATWTGVGSADGGAHPFTGMGFSKIAIHPLRPDVLVASTGVGSDYNFAHSAFPQGNPAFAHLGIYRSADAGATWSRVKEAASPDNNVNGTFSIDLVYEPERRVFVAGIARQGLYVSHDGEVWRTFDEAGLPTAGLPGRADMFRIRLATRRGTLWALIIDHYYTQDSDIHKLFELTAGASSWREIPIPVNLDQKGLLTIVAAPPDSDELVVGSLFLHRTDDITPARPLWIDLAVGADVSLHGDQHAIAFVDKDRWYVGDDGGLFATLDRGATWRSLNATLRTMEFYSASPAADDSGAYVGGQQDNGQGYSLDGSTWFQFLLGDGMYTHADPRSPTGFFASAQRGDLYYLEPGAPPRSVFKLPGPPDVPDDVPAFLTPYEILPSDPRLYEGVPAPPGFDFSQARLLLTGNTNPWLVAFTPGIETIVTRKLTDQVGETIQYLAPVPQDVTMAYAVTGAGHPEPWRFEDANYSSSLYRLRNISLAGTATVETVPKPEQASETPATDVLGHAVVSPVCSESLYVVKVGWLEGRKLFKTTTSGASWTNISGNLPNVPVHWIAFDPLNPDVVYVGTNVGAFVATDGGVEGEQWQRLGTGLPNVPVMQLKVSATRTLVAATYGRGIWTLALPALTPWTPKAPVVSDVSLSESVLWPPDHRMVDVTVNYAAADDCGIPICALSVSSSEPGDGLGDGDTPVDYQVVDARRVRLRAERAGSGAGRAYTIGISCTGLDGLVTTTSAVVSVPHDQK